MIPERSTTLTSIQELVSELLSNTNAHIDEYSSPAFWNHLNAIHDFHLANSSEYRIISKHFSTDLSYSGLPFLPVSLFKYYAFRSISDDQVYRVLQSSGTSGQAPSKIYLDRINSKHQQIALSTLFTFFTKLSRPNILILDTPATASRKAPFTARKAGILGFSSLCRKSFYGLKDDYTIDYESIELAIESSPQLLIFGFTFMVYKYLLAHVQSFPSLPPGLKVVFLHGGGWKKLKDLSLSTSEFNDLVLRKTQISTVINYYGMVEQTGTIFFECPHGFMHTNNLASLIPRNLDSLTPDFRVGDHLRIAQVLSALPTSYPGHSLLTDDLITIPYLADNCTCGMKGLPFKIHGRIPKSEPRGCSDTHQTV
jgi:hypothetical protein